MSGDNIVIFQSLNEKVFATRIAKLLGYKVFWVEHLSVFSWLSKSPLKNKYIKRSRMVDRIMTVSDLLKNELISIGVDENKIETVYFGIDMDSFYPLEEKIVEAKKKEFAFYKDSKIIGYV